MLEILRRIVQEVNAAPNLETALKVIVEQVQTAMGTEVVSVYLMNHVQNRYELKASVGLNPEAVGKVSLGIAEGLVGQVGLREEPINLEDAASHPKFRYLAETGEEKFKAFMGVPIIHQKKMLGVLVVQQRASRRFDQGEEAFLVTMSAQLSGVIAHAEATGAIDRLGVKTSKAKFNGVAGSSGIGIGQAFVVYPPANLKAIPDRKAENIEEEIERFKKALQEVREDVKKIQEMAGLTLPPEESALFDVYLRMLDDNALGAEIVAKIQEGHWAQGALGIIVREHIHAFEMMEDAYLRERAADIRDLGLRVLAKLQDVHDDEPKAYPKDTILVGEEITTSVLMEVPKKKLKGVVSIRGSSNSHMAIVARSMGVPTVVGAVDMPYSRVDGSRMIVDGYHGEVFVNPSPDIVRQFDAILREEAELFAGLEGVRDLPSVTPDGQAVTLWVNTGLMTDVTLSLERGAEGVGLYRTEIPFMSKERFPSESEQAEIYRDQLSAFAPHPVTMRTLDIGGDKALPYFPIQEENPFLGWRGIRVTLDHPEIFMVQVRAMLKASEGLDNLRIMLPMVTTVAEAEEGQHLVHRAFLEVLEEGYHVSMPPIGIMVEVPAAVYQAREYAQIADFLSVGSNDLTQYILAVDRNNPRVADLYHGYHPAVLQALKQVVDQAKLENTPVSICGEMAGEPSTAALLMAMGYDTLSMSASSLLKVKWMIRHLPMAKAREFLNDVMSMDNADVIRSYLDFALAKEGLGRLVRPSRRK